MLLCVPQGGLRWDQVDLNQSGSGHSRTGGPGYVDAGGSSQDGVWGLLLTIKGRYFSLDLLRSTTNVTEAERSGEHKSCCEQLGCCVTAVAHILKLERYRED